MRESPTHVWACRSRVNPLFRFDYFENFDAFGWLIQRHGSYISGEFDYVVSKSQHFEGLEGTGLWSIGEHLL